MTEKQPPKGVVAVFVGPDGRCVASVSDFDYSGYGGFSLQQSQEVRVQDAIARKVANALCSSDFTRHMETHDMKRVMRQMIDRDGYKLHIIPVGHEAAP